MKRFTQTIQLVLFLSLGSILTNALQAQTVKPTGDELLNSETPVYQQEKNTVSNVEFTTTNYGIFGLDVESSSNGGTWPRNSKNGYIFGGGIWFGAQKLVDGKMRSLVELSYNPNTGKSWMVPGRIENGPNAEQV